MPGLRALADLGAGAALAAREGARLLCDRLRGASGCPGRLTDLTPGWVERALAPACPAARVRGLRVIDATRGTTERARLVLDAGAGAPASLFAKLAPRDPATRVFVGALGLGAREVRFYQALAAALPVRAPRVFHADFEPATGRFVLVLEDLASAGAEFGDAARACTPERAEAVVRALARLHAWLWRSPRFAGELDWLGPRRGAAARAERLLREQLCARAVRRFGDLLPPPVRDATARLARGFDALAAAAACAPPALLHGDPHLGNLYFAGDEPGFLDWQATQYGDALRDVGYFLVLSLDVEARRTHEAALYDAWRDALAAAGAQPPAAAELLRGQRHAAVYALTAALVTLGAGRLQPGPVVQAGLARAAAAVLDLEALRSMP